VSSPALAPATPARAHHLPAAGCAAAAVVLLVALPELLGDLGRLAAVIVLQLGLVLVWVLVTGIQGFAGSLTVGAAAAVAADLVLVLPARPAMGGLLTVFGVSFLAAVLQQMVRRPRPELVASLAGTALLLAVTGALATLLLLGRTDAGHGRALVALLAVGAALVAGHLADLVLPRPQLADGVPCGLLGLVLAVLAGAVVTFLGRDVSGTVDALAAVIYGAVLGGVAALVSLVASYVVVEAEAAGPPDGEQPPPVWALALIQGVLPLAACGPVALALQSVL
jgi:hypothetical protein